MHTELHLNVPSGFNFKSVVYSHGWSALWPFQISEESLTLNRIVQLRGESLVSIGFSQGTSNTVRMDVQSLSQLRPEAVAQLRETAASMMQAALNLRPFYALTNKHPRLAWAKRAGAGRMLRGQTFFEDTVKTILTTNCSWSLTTSMNQRLVEHFGQRNSLGFRAFPAADAIAASSPEYLRSECKLGYRAEFVYELSERCASGSLDIEGFRTSNAPAEELFAELRAIKGIGEYAAANLLRLLGKFNYLGLDSWCRNKIAEIHGNGVPLPDSDIETLYHHFGEWKGLAMWLDVTRQWYHDKFPLQ